MNDRMSRASLEYLAGLGGHHQSEAIPGALPVGRNSPQKVPFGLYAEQLSGSSFTMPRAQNLRSWLYRIRPSAMQRAFEPVSHAAWQTAPSPESQPSPDRLRWLPQPLPTQSTDFVDGLFTLAVCGDA
jgi:homogentisate 1,2-dioxygenase